MLDGLAGLALRMLIGFAQEPVEGPDGKTGKVSGLQADHLIHSSYTGTATGGPLYSNAQEI